MSLSQHPNGVGSIVFIHIRQMRKARFTVAARPSPGHKACMQEWGSDSSSFSFPVCLVGQRFWMCGSSWEAERGRSGMVGALNVLEGASVVSYKPWKAVDHRLGRWFECTGGIFV